MANKVTGNDAPMPSHDITGGLTLPMWDEIEKLEAELIRTGVERHEARRLAKLQVCAA